MNAMHRAALPLVFVTLLLSCREPERPPSDPEGSFAFAATGDAPYDSGELTLVEEMIEELNTLELSGVVHVGDIMGYPCAEENYPHRYELFERIDHPFLYTPGDNEWTDCWRDEGETYTPHERLELLRSTFFQEPSLSLGGQRIPVQSQAEQPLWQEFPENARWQWNGVVFATFHLVGSGNGLNPFPTRTAADTEEVMRRTNAAVEWLRQTFAEAQEVEAPALVLVFHAELGFVHPPGDPLRKGFEPFLEALEQEAARFEKPILLIHGDDHEYIIDQPLVDRRNGMPLEQVTRLQVFGSPDVGYVRVVVHPGGEPTFRFEPTFQSQRWSLSRLFSGHF